jgi:hypothetical protein
MYPQRQEVTLYDNVTPVAITSSTDATPIVVTATAHGLKNGQRVLIYGHATNVAANGIFVVASVTTNTFALKDEITGASVAGSGAGAGSGGICVVAPPVLRAVDFKTADFFILTSGTATVTLCAIGSPGVPEPDQSSPRYDYPNMGATKSHSNPWGFLQLADLNTGSGITGATGVVVAGTDISNQYEVNTNEVSFLTMIPISWSAGAITIKAVLRTNA